MYCTEGVIILHLVSLAFPLKFCCKSVVSWSCITHMSYKHLGFTIGLPYCQTMHPGHLPMNLTCHLQPLPRSCLALGRSKVLAIQRDHWHTAPNPGTAKFQLVRPVPQHHLIEAVFSNMPSSHAQNDFRETPISDQNENCRLTTAKYTAIRPGNDKFYNSPKLPGKDAFWKVLKLDKKYSIPSPTFVQLSNKACSTPVEIPFWCGAFLVAPWHPWTCQVRQIFIEKKNHRRGTSWKSTV